MLNYETLEARITKKLDEIKLEAFRSQDLHFYLVYDLSNDQINCYEFTDSTSYVETDNKTTFYITRVHIGECDPEVLTQFDLDDLVDNLIEAYDFEIPENWNDMSVDEALEYVRKSEAYEKWADGVFSEAAADEHEIHEEISHEFITHLQSYLNK